MNTRKLKDVQLTLRKGEILGLVGLVGSGRTELVRALFGADKVAKKSIYLDGKPVEVNSPIDAINLGLAMVPEERKLQGLLLGFPVEQNISLAVLARLTEHGFIDAKEEGAVSDRQIKALNIKTPSGKTKIRTLSGGNQQKAILGRWLEMNPRILVLDEPTKGIDVGAKYEIYLLMKKIVEDGGVDHPDLIRAARGPPHEQPGQHDQRWPGQRRVRPDASPRPTRSWPRPSSSHERRDAAGRASGPSRRRSATS